MSGPQSQSLAAHPETPAEVRRITLHLLSGIRAQEPEYRGAVPRTVRDVVLERPITRRCVIGPISSSVSAAHIRNQRGACAGYKCPHCVDYRMSQDVTRILRIWRYPSEVYSRRFSAEDWGRRTQEMNRLRAAHPLRAQVNLENGDLVILSPEPIPESECLPALPALVDALLQTHSAPGRGSRRFVLARTTECQAAEASIEEQDDGRESRLWTQVASHHDLPSVKRRYDAALRDDGRWLTEIGRRGTPFSQSDERAISEEQHSTAVQVWNELRDERLYELEVMRAGREASTESGRWSGAIKQMLAAAR